VNSIFIPDFPLPLPLSPDSGGEGGVRGDSHGAFYATFRSALHKIPLKAYFLRNFAQLPKSHEEMSRRILRKREASFIPAAEFSLRYPASQKSEKAISDLHSFRFVST
jgi:hypothetical protein